MFEANDRDISFLIRDKDISLKNNEIMGLDVSVESSKDIYLIDGSVSSVFCDQVVDLVETYGDWDIAKTLGEVHLNAPREKSKRQNKLCTTKDYPNIDKGLFNIFSHAISILKKEYEELTLTADEGYGVLRYQKGDFYKNHIDRGVHGNTPNRAISAILYLNENYEGGETYFHKQDISIRPKKGRVALFPSAYTHEHESKEVLSGTKYNVVTWFY